MRPDWTATFFEQGVRAALNTLVNGLPDTCPGPGASPSYRQWWWRGYHYQKYMLEHPQQAELTEDPA